MAAASNDRAIGQLEGKVDALLLELKEHGRRSIEAEERAVESRARVYERLEALSQDAAVRETRETMRLDTIDKEIAFIKKAHEATDKKVEAQGSKIDTWEVRFTTVVGVVSVMGGLIGGAMVYFKDRVISYLFGT